MLKKILLIVCLATSTNLLCLEPISNLVLPTPDQQRALDAESDPFDASASYLATPRPKVFTGWIKNPAALPGVPSSSEDEAALAELEAQLKAAEANRLKIHQKYTAARARLMQEVVRRPSWLKPGQRPVAQAQSLKARPVKSPRPSSKKSKQALAKMIASAQKAKTKISAAKKSPKTPLRKKAGHRHAPVLTRANQRPLPAAQPKAMRIWDKENNMWHPTEDRLNAIWDYNDGEWIEIPETPRPGEQNFGW